MCPAGTVVAPWSVTQEVTGSSLSTVMTNIQRIQWIQRKSFRKNSDVFLLFTMIHS